MKKLMLHAGGYETAFDQVCKVRTPTGTDTWTPIPHHAFVEQVRKGLDTAGLGIVTEQHALAKDGKRYFGLLQVNRRGMNAPDHGLVVGLRNTHDKMFPAGIVAGAGVFVCDNLSFTGEVDEFRKHTVNIVRDLPTKIMRAIGGLGELWTNQAKRFDAYKETPIKNTLELHDLCIRACDAQQTKDADGKLKKSDLDAFPITYLPHVLNEFRNPSHAEFKNKNVWSLFNAFTEAAKGSNIADLPNRTQRLHVLFDDFCGVKLAKVGNN
jgi:hypothetical protein